MKRPLQMARSQPKAKTIVIVILKELETKQKDLVNVSMTFICVWNETNTSSIPLQSQE